MSLEPRIAAPSGEGPWFGTELDRAIDAYAAAAMRATALDPVTTELVRLRCARYHDCRLCGSLRLDEAQRAGLDEEAELDARHTAALRLTDAMIMAPGTIDEDLRAELHRHFSDEELTELTHDIVKWSFQKVRVALRLEAPPRDGLSVLSFDADGHATIGAAVSV
jgi:AhpD family alkylhydroperoxidase